MKDYYGEELLADDEVFPMEDFEGLNCDCSYKILGFDETSGMITITNELGVRRMYGAGAFVLNPAGRMFKSAEAIALAGSLEKSESSDRSDS